MTDEIPPTTRNAITKTVVASMLVRASRIVNVAEARDGRIAIIPVDTFRMNMLAIGAALDGETSAERLAIDEQGAARIAEILHEGQGHVSITLSTELVEQARQLYGAAARAGKQVEADRDAHYGDATSGPFNLARPQYQAVAAAAMMLGEILSRVVAVEDGERDAG